MVAFGAIVFAAGLAIAGHAASPLMLMLGMGVLVGVGVSCTAFGVIMPAIGRLASSEKRSMAMGTVSAAGSLGQVVLVPLAQGVTDWSGPAVAFLVLARGGVRATPEPDAVRVPRWLATAQALGHRGFCLLTLGFFTCGFQLAFIATHVPKYLAFCHMPVGLGATALALIGLFNMAGCWGFGWLGGRFRQQNLLGWLYLVRSAAIAAFFLLPKTPASVIIFAITMGLAWLGTVPLTSGLVAKVFGLRHLGTLFGVCFLSHQVGSFLGAWLGGYLFDLTGSYSIVWSATAIAGLAAAALHFAIDDRPVTLRPAAGAIAVRA